jgi:hypothetical protein
MYGRYGEDVANPREENDYLGGFGLFHDQAEQSRIVKWDSAA